MRMLFISNLYPPYHLGGTELLCQDVAAQLRARGHTVTILTSTFGITSLQNEPGVYRRLRLESNIYAYRPWQVLRYWSNTRANRLIVDEVFAETDPDLVVIWGMYNLSRQIAVWFEALAGSKVVYYLAGPWPIEPSALEAYWEGSAKSLAGKAFKRIGRVPMAVAMRKEWRPYPLRYEHVIACCKALRDDSVNAGVPIEQAKIIYHGIDVEVYRAASQKRRPDLNGILRITFVGSVSPAKGVHTAVEAMGILASDPKSAPMTLDILGKGLPQYEQQLHDMVLGYHIEDRVSFHQPIPRTELPDFLAKFDVLAMPSIWEEMLALISEEAMASSLVLVGTLTGGTKEILIDGQNGLAFEKEDARELASQLQRLATQPELRVRLTEAAWQTVSSHFTMTHMINQLESYLADIAKR